MTWQGSIEGMCFVLLVLHDMTKKNYTFEAKRESPNPGFVGTGNIEVKKSWSYQENMVGTPIESNKVVS